MNTAKCSPGPWSAIHDADGDYGIYSEFEPIAVTYTDSDTDAANALLMAAAPMMADLLRCFPIFHPEERERAIRAWAAKYEIEIAPQLQSGAWELAQFEDKAIESCLAKAVSNA